MTPLDIVYSLIAVRLSQLNAEKAEFEELGAPDPDCDVEVESRISELERLRDMMDSAFPHLDVNAGV